MILNDLLPVISRFSEDFIKDLVKFTLVGYKLESSFDEGHKL